ncbi:uncharacterized protein LACBIDRAFT_335968 [Laccaria bicolor S238N-H82]|uniref:Predicted protein n=1 Tax=Laccaria bicolor (strain S238N-H82 / ATCC MYA-4686) TaxID=486041 RepID=B0E3Z8_LACBS|nr:uncharacterized protein LACBIDRAFT_335968 [Laccaria bicolor S238N-H82]EDQ98431.1 predicted protein [Laccaria bicolor S238N-H82]|eukprot:XP_001890915.1 predicted protein [Laccaria bicolor S238N-H82]
MTNEDAICRRRHRTTIDHGQPRTITTRQHDHATTTAEQQHTTRHDHYQTSKVHVAVSNITTYHGRTTTRTLMTRDGEDDLACQWTCHDVQTVTMHVVVTVHVNPEKMCRD